MIDLKANAKLTTSLNASFRYNVTLTNIIFRTFWTLLKKWIYIKQLIIVLYLSISILTCTPTTNGNFDKVKEPAVTQITTIVHTLYSLPTYAHLILRFVVPILIQLNIFNFLTILKESSVSCFWMLICSKILIELVFVEYFFSYIICWNNALKLNYSR